MSIRISKKWGYEEIFISTDLYCCKHLVFTKGGVSSWHKHNKKIESWYLLSGEIILKYGYDNDIGKATYISLKPGCKFHIPAGLLHQVSAWEDSVILECSTYDDPDDCIRLIPSK